jgi:vanillate O-demethylase monooxygenase subunit
MTAPAAATVVAPAESGPPADCTFDAADWTILARHWYPIALSREVGAAPVPVRLLDVQLVVYRAGEEVVVAPDLCPHRGVPLSAGTSDGTGLTCAYHGLRFAEGGRCVRIPASPEARIPRRMHLRTYPVVQRYGLVWTCLRPAGGDDVPSAERDVPPMPSWDEPGFQCVTCPSIDIAAFAGRQVEGFLDVAHFAFVHAGSFGDPGNPEVPEYTTQRREDGPPGFRAEYWSTVSNYPPGDPRDVPGFRWLRHFELYQPFTATLVVHFPHGGLLSIMNAASPVSARRTRMFAPIARNFDTDQPAEAIYEFNRRIFEEDRAIVEIQRPENLPLDPRIEVNIAADRSSVAYRRGLRELGLSHFFTA